MRIEGASFEKVSDDAICYSNKFNLSHRQTDHSETTLDMSDSRILCEKPNKKTNHSEKSTVDEMNMSHDRVYTTEQFSNR